MIIANENTKYQLKQIITEIIYILNTELKQRTHYENDRISISHIPIINIFRGQRIGINMGYGHITRLIRQSLGGLFGRYSGMVDIVLVVWFWPHVWWFGFGSIFGSLVLAASLVVWSVETFGGLCN